jgi:hypothetical protein
VKDLLGYDIEAGSFIAYAVRSGQVAALRYGVVVSIEGGQLRVRGVDKDWRTGKLKLNARDGVLAGPERVIGFSAAHLPSAAFALLFNHYKLVVKGAT